MKYFAMRANNRQLSNTVNLKSARQTANRLINAERKRRKLSTVRWSREMYAKAKEQADTMSSAGRLIHSHRYALKGGENCWGGKGYFAKSSEQLARDMVGGWMSSPRHRAWLLDGRVKSAAVAISISRHGTFAAWAFSDSISYKHKPKRYGKSTGSIFHRLNSFFNKLFKF